jgi:O-antigen/teichoic acid export membrane protein
MSRVGKKLAIGASLNVVYLVATLAISFFITPFVLHALGDRLYGIWTLVAAFTGYYNILEFGLSTAVSRYVANALGASDNDRCNVVFNTSLAIFSLIGLFVMAASVAAAAGTRIVVHNPQDAALFAKAILILGAALALGFPLRVYKGVLMAHLRFGPTAGLDILTLILRTVLVIAVILRGYKVLGLALATLLSVLPGLVLYPYFQSRNLPFLRISFAAVQRAMAKEMFSYSFFSFIAHLGGVLRGPIGPFIVAPFLGLVAVTHFKIASLVAGYSGELVAALIGGFSPLLSQMEGAGDLEGLKKNTLFATKIALCLTGLVSFGAIGLGRVFLTRWVGRSYENAYPCMVLLVLGGAAAVAQRPTVYAVYAVARHQFFALLIVLEGVGNILISLLLVRRLGLVGVGLGVLIPVWVIKLVIQPVYVCRVTGIPYSEYARTFLTTLLKVLAALVLPSIIVLRWGTPQYGAIFALAAICTVLYAVPVFAKVLNPSEKRLVMDTLMPELLRKASH